MTETDLLDRAIQTEPRLGDLFMEARMKRGATWDDYERMKRRLGWLVGWYAERRELCGSELYQLAVRRLETLLMK